MSNNQMSNNQHLPKGAFLVIIPHGVEVAGSGIQLGRRVVRVVQQLELACLAWLV